MTKQNGNVPLRDIDGCGYTVITTILCLQMEKLSLDEIHLNDKAALALSQCSHKLQRLKMFGCSLTPIGWTTLFGGLTVMQDKVIRFEILHCMFT